MSYTVDKKTFYPVEEVAAILGINRATIYTRIKQGKAPSLEGIGRRKGYFGKTLIAMLKGQV